MACEVTLFITSCGRFDLLKRTLTSFVKHNTYPIKEVILCEDSGITDVNGFKVFIETIISYPIIFCINEIQIGQMKTIEKYTPLINTPYVFHLEDDYEFFKSGFIELSFEILDSEPLISQVLLEDEQCAYPTISINNNLCRAVMTNHPHEKNANYGDGPLHVFSWRPSLKHTTIQKLRMPYQPWDDEYTIELQINKLGMYSVISSKNPSGFCRHIGKNYHVSTNNQKHKILGRADFPDKAQIRLKDI